MTEHVENQASGQRGWLGAATPSGSPPLLAVDAKTLGAMLGLSLRTVRTLDASGKLPRPVKIGARSIRWPVCEIEDWLAAGAPDRRVWESLRKAGTHTVVT